MLTAIKLFIFVWTGTAIAISIACLGYVKGKMEERE